MDDHVPYADGLSLRELLLEVRADVKEIRETLSNKPDRKEVYGVMFSLMTIITALIGLFL